ncbi:hypothetical protein PBY51_003443 [Eleginops maclovinus]|uniref:Uncharacterized protein n=1 Tax=Eleginops maclovinus TaxID=56733 RepID=A0AAN7Y129_ELEMC|nr:hypothetical protein PBY51_003443 [Eleginops maclovinus]
MAERSGVSVVMEFSPSEVFISHSKEPSCSRCSCLRKECWVFGGRQGLELVMVVYAAGVERLASERE